MIYLILYIHLTGFMFTVGRVLHALADDKGADAIVHIIAVFFLWPVILGGLSAQK